MISIIALTLLSVYTAGLLLMEYVSVRFRRQETELPIRDRPLMLGSIQVQGIRTDDPTYTIYEGSNTSCAVPAQVYTVDYI